MEIEAKLTAPSPDVLHRVASLREVCGYRVAAASEHLILDVYFDTPRRTLYKRMASLRLRRMDGIYYATFKACNRTAGAVHSREALEKQLPSRRAFRDRSNPPLPCQRARALVGGKLLRPTLIVRNRRRVLRLSRERVRSLGILLDDVVFVGRGGRKTFYEIEIEGAEEMDCAAIEEVAEWLRARFALELSGPSKYATGLAMLGSL